MFSCKTEEVISRSGYLFGQSSGSIARGEKRVQNDQQNLRSISGLIGKLGTGGVFGIFVERE